MYGFRPEESEVYLLSPHDPPSKVPWQRLLTSVLKLHRCQDEP